MDQRELIPALTLALGIIFLVAGTKLKIGNLLAPYSIALIMVISIFAVRPLLMLSDGNFSFYGIDISSGFVQSTTVGLLSVCSLGFGHMIGRSSIARREIRANSASFSPRDPRILEPKILSAKYVTTSMVIALIILSAWLTITVVSGGGFSYLVQLFAGRSKDLGRSIDNMPVIVAALPVVAALTLSVARIRYERAHLLSTSQRLAYWLVGALAVIPPSALGNRRFIVPAVIALVVGSLQNRWFSRVSLKMVSLAFFAFLVLTIFPFVRSAGSRTNSKDLLGAMYDYFSTTGLKGSIDAFFLSYDTEMFNYVAYLAPRLGEEFPLGYGRGTVGELFLAALPERFSPVMKWSNILLSEAFGGSCGEVYCPVPSLPGTLFYDFTYVGVILGMSLLGLHFAKYTDRDTDTWANPCGFVIVFAFTMVVIRGNPISQIWIALQCYIVLYLLDKVLIRMAAKSPSNQPVPDGLRPDLQRGHDPFIGGASSVRNG